MRDRGPLSIMIASVALLGVIGLVALLGRDAQPVEFPPVEATPEVVTPPPPPAETQPTPEVVERATPLHVRISTIRVDAPIVEVGLEADGAMEIPERVAEIGWYDPDGLGVAPGVAGTAVLAGHVDSRSQGRGALYDLRALQVGETIELDLSDGTTQTWRITEVVQYPKDFLPFDELFVWSGPPRLAVITCGGEFDRTARSYRDNLVAYAEPLEVGPTPSSSPGAASDAASSPVAASSTSNSAS